MGFITKVCLSRGKTAAGKNMKYILKGGKKMAKLTVQNLARNIVNAVQAEVAKIPDFENGAIRLLFVPKCSEAVKYLCGFGKDCEPDLVFPAKEGGKHVRPAGFRGSNEPECDCYGYTAIKIGGCAYAVKHDLGRRSSDMPEDAITWGRVNDKGCVAYDVSYANRLGISDNPPYKHYFRLYVAVSGAEGEEDEQCALAASNVLQKWCDTELESDGFGHYGKCLEFKGPE